MKLVAVIAFLVMSQPIIAQHYGGVFFSSDYVPSLKYHWSHETGDFFKDHHFSWGYTFGYQGQMFQQKRISLSYGLQYSSRSTFEEAFGAPYGCVTGIDLEAYIPKRLEEEWKSIELPLAIRLNILKTSKFQPYISGGIGFTYPIVYSVRLIDEAGNSETASFLTDNYIKRVDATLEAAAGLNYSVKKYILNLHTFIRHMETQGKLGVGLAAMRKF